MPQAVGRGWGAVVSACMQLTCIERHARKLHRRQPLGSTQLATKHLMREAIRGNQIPEAIRSQRQSEAISTQLATKHLMREAIKGHQIQLSAISTGRSRASGMMMDAIKASGMMMDACNRMQSKAIKRNQYRPKSRLRHKRRQTS